MAARRIGRGKLSGERSSRARAAGQHPRQALRDDQEGWGEKSRKAQVIARRLLPALCALVWAGACHALQLDETRKDLRLSLSEDFMHAHGATLLSGRYGA